MYLNQNSSGSKQGFENKNEAHGNNEDGCVHQMCRFAQVEIGKVGFGR